MAGPYYFQEFALWTPGYGGATVTIYEADGTTKADLYYDLDKAQPATNPFTLATTTIGGVSYGRCSQPIYVDAASYKYDCSTLGSSGTIKAPLTSLEGEDASNATVEVANGNATALAEMFTIDALGVVSVQAYGQLAASEATANNALLVTCIGVASALGGGTVLIPPGTWAYDHFELPTGVILKGAGKDVTTLVSTYAGVSIKPTGPGAGLEDITVDGQSLIGSSIGIDLDGQDAFACRRVTLKRFELGIKQHGGSGLLLEDFDLDNCATGCEGWSDTTADGHHGAMRDLRWLRGSLTNCTTMGLQLKDDAGTGVRWIRIEKVRFSTNLGPALEIWGAQFVEYPDCEFEQNTQHVNIKDNTDLTPKAPVVSIRTERSSFLKGKISATGTCQDVIWSACRFETHVWDIQLPTNSLLLEGCLETSDVTVTGSTIRLQRRRRLAEGKTTVVTASNDASGLVIWSAQMVPGQTAIIEAHVTCNGNDNLANGAFVIRARAVRPPDQLLYDNQTANFALGFPVVGQTSKASGLLVAQTDSGASGTLQLRQVNGDYIDNEPLSSTAGGSAQANGTLAHQSVVVSDASKDFTSRSNSGLTVDITGSATEVQVKVVGLANQRIEWSAECSVVLST